MTLLLYVIWYQHLKLLDTKLKLNSVALVRERTIPTERPPPVGEVSANFSGHTMFKIHYSKFHYKFSNKVKSARKIIKINSGNYQAYDDKVTKKNSCK